MVRKGFFVCVARIFKVCFFLRIPLSLSGLSSKKISLIGDYPF